MNISNEQRLVQNIVTTPSINEKKKKKHVFYTIMDILQTI